MDELAREQIRIQVSGMTEEEFRVEVLAKLNQINGTARANKAEIHGDETRGNVGLKPRVIIAETRLDSHDARWSAFTSRLVGIAIGAGLVSGSGVFGLIKLMGG